MIIEKKHILVFLCIIPSYLTPDFKPAQDNSSRSIESAVSFYNNGKINNSINEYKKALKYYPNSTSIHSNLALLFEEAGNYNESILEHLEALRNNPKDVYISLNLARLYRNHEQAEKAKIIYKGILANFEFDASDRLIEFNTRIGLVYSLLKLKQENEALVELDELTRKYPKHSLIYLEYANILEKKEEFGKAIELYKKALTLDNSLSFLHLRIAKLYENIHYYACAYNSYAKASAIDPENKSIKKSKIRVHEKLERYINLISRKEEEKKEMEVPPSYIPVEDKNIPVIRVGLIEQADSICMKSKSPIDVCSDSSGVLGSLDGNEYFKIIRYGKKGKTNLLICDKKGKTVLKFKKLITLVQKDKTASITIFDIKYGRNYFWAGTENRSYRGNIEIIPDSNKLTAVNIISLEEYLYGVLPGEIEEFWGKESLKAQAISARTYALSRYKSHNIYDVCSDVHCAVYKGLKSERKVFRDAVDETRGFVLMKDYKLVSTFYHDSCGGHTRTSEAAWGCKIYPEIDNKTDSENLLEYSFPLSPYDLEKWIKYAPQVFCNAPTCASMSHFRWVKKLTKNELEIMLKKYKNIGSLRDIKITERSNEGFVNEIAFYGSKGEFLVKKDKIRKVLDGLRSNLFQLEKNLNKKGIMESVIIFGGGWGHGVGLCQTGAASMAEKGFNCEKILLHYFPKSRIISNYEDKVCLKYSTD